MDVSKKKKYDYSFFINPFYMSETYYFLLNNFYFEDFFVFSELIFCLYKIKINAKILPDTPS